MAHQTVRNCSPHNYIYLNENSIILNQMSVHFAQLNALTTNKLIKRNLINKFEFHNCALFMLRLLV